RGEERPVLENLLKSYTPDQARMYLGAYDCTVGTSETQILRKAQYQANLSKKTKRSAEPVKRNMRQKTW
ncbi:MAG TPA: hypothetical protein PLD88_05790, partial [Candidatus Berkiella sp.]|nr:hypothetical protein [Candidatus Berkiella sp.]